jgi:glycosyltransferase involved in cell wall biosynthesis
MKPDMRMAIIRPIGVPVSRNFYNSQEIGLARGLSQYGIHVDVYVAGKGSQVVTRNIASSGSGSVRLFEVPFVRLPLIDQAFYPKLAGLLAKGDYHFIQVNEENELTSFLVARFARKRGIRVVLYQGMYVQLTGRIYAAFQSLYDRVLLPCFRRYIDLALVKTSRAGRHLEGKGFQKIRILPVGLDPTPFSNQNDMNWREKLDIPAASTILLYVGIFEQRRNVDFMVDLAKQLAAEGVVLVMAGSGPEHARIAARVTDETITNVRLAGSVSQDLLPSLYRESSLFLLPSDYEIYGMVVIEAMYFGLPVLSTRTAGPEDIIESGADGILLDDVDVTQWCEAIRGVLTNRNKLETMGTAARRKIEETLLWQHVAKEYCDNVIYKLVGHR